MNQLKETIYNLVPKQQQKIDYILSHFQHKRILKDDFFVEAGEKCNEVAFIKSGIIRFFYINQHHEETTCYFAFPAEFITSKYSFNTKKDSKESLQAVIDTELWVIKRDDIEKLYAEIPEVQGITSNAYEKLSSILQKRIAMLQINSAEERYDYLLKHHSVLLQTVPLRYVASFIGVTPQHLSRLRKLKTISNF